MYASAPPLHACFWRRGRNSVRLIAARRSDHDALKVPMTSGCARSLLVLSGDAASPLRRQSEGAHLVHSRVVNVRFPRQCRHFLRESTVCCLRAAFTRSCAVSTMRGVEDVFPAFLSLTCAASVARSRVNSPYSGLCQLLRRQRSRGLR